MYVSLSYDVLAFCLFFFLEGVFWPAMGVLRSKYVPESGNRYLS